MATHQISPVEPMSPVGRLVNVIVEPQRAFADIAARPGWWPPMILLVVLSIVYMAAFSSHVGWERFMRHQIETNKQTQNLSAEQRETQIQMGAKYAAPLGTGMAIVMVPVSMLLFAGVYLFIFNTALGANLTYRPVLGVVSHSMVPGVISTAAALGVMFLKDPAEFDLNNPAGFNLGFYLDPQSSPAWLVSLGNSIDVFSIWILLLLATGMSVASRRSWKTSLAGVVAPWALYVVLKVGWAAIRG
jgi:hypothetical protein